MSGFNRGSSGFPKNKNSRIVYLLNSHLIRNRYKLKHYRVIPFFSTTRGHLRLLAFSTLSTIYVNFRLTNDIPTEQGTKTVEKASTTIVGSLDCCYSSIRILSFRLTFSLFFFFFFFLLFFYIIYWSVTLTNRVHHVGKIADAQKSD